MAKSRLEKLTQWGQLAAWCAACAGVIFSCGMAWSKAQAAIDKVEELETWKAATQDTLTSTKQRVDDIAYFLHVPPHKEILP